MAEPSDSSGRRTVVASRRDSWQARSEAEDPIQERQERLTKKYLVGSRLNRTKSNASDALSGDPTRAAIASCAAGMVQASLLLPMNTVQTQMQFRGVSLPATLRLLFAHGPLSGMANLYRAIMPTVGMLGARQGLKFGSGAAFKRRLPLHWPEPARDACAGGLSALTSTTLLFPIDTLKTRWQMGMATPRLDQWYQGFRPAASYSAFGMALWVMMRNALERNLPEPAGGSALAYWKHFLCGGLAGVFVQARRPARHHPRTPACRACAGAPPLPPAPRPTLTRGIPSSPRLTLDCSLARPTPALAPDPWWPRRRARRRCPPSPLTRSRSGCRPPTRPGSSCTRRACSSRRAGRCASTAASRSSVASSRSTAPSSTRSSSRCEECWARTRREKVVGEYR